MIKKQILLSILFISTTIFSQIPRGYYNNARGSGYTLKSQLHNIIKSGHKDRGYKALYGAYKTTDTDIFYENDNTVLDMYSENPYSKDSYNYSHNKKTCGSYRGESSCYNREHIFPQGFFNKRAPMRSDIHHVVPTDGYVNNRRSNYPFGEVASASWTSRNGSKVGTNSFGSYRGKVFEPIDEFKGDIARILLYFVTRYEDKITGFNTGATNNPLDGSKSQGYENWYIDLLLKWHKQDPVSNREISRNNNIYKFQGNRNPFIDHPEYVEKIWGDNDYVTDDFVASPSNLNVNTANNKTTITWTASKTKGVSYVISFGSGYSYKTYDTSYSFEGLQEGTYTVSVHAKKSGNLYSEKISKTFTISYETAGIEDITDNTPSFDVYPNPSRNGKVTIINNTSQIIEEVYVYSVTLGQLIYQDENVRYSDEYKLKNLKRGVYLLVLKTNTDIITKKIIVK